MSVLSSIFYAILLLITFIVYRFLIRPFVQYKAYRKLGLHGGFFPILGLAWDGLQSLKKYGDTLQTYKALSETDPKAKIWVSNFGSRVSLQVLDAELLKEYYNKAQYFEKVKMSLGMGKLMGNGLLRVEGEKWKQRRKLISSMFHFEFIKDNIPLIVNTTKEFFGKLKATDMKNVAIMDEVQKITGEIVGRIFFGQNLNSYNIDGELLTLHLADLIGETSQMGNHPLIIFIGFLGLSPSKLKIYKPILAKIEKFRSVCFKIVQDRKSSGTTGTDLLGKLLQFQEKTKGTDDYLSDEDIVDEFITFFVAGMDTTGHNVAMTIYLLCKYPDYISQLQKEINDVYLRKDIVSNDDLNQMDFTHSCIKESLRMYSPAPGIVPRLVDKDFNLGPYVIKKGVSIRPNFIYNWFNPTYFPEPFKFVPERWAKVDKLDSFVFTPFSSGARNCIGQHLAQIEAKIILSEFLKDFDFKLSDPNYNLRMKFRFLYEPEKKLNVDLTKK